MTSAAALALVVSLYGASRLGRDFLPPFNEGAAQVNVVAPPGTSLETSNAIARQVEERLKAAEGVQAFSRRTGRAEQDEHAEGVNVSEIVITFDEAGGLSREQALAQIRRQLAEVPGVQFSAEQPLAHLISHMVSGVRAQVGIKVFGEDLEVLRRLAEEIREEAARVEGVVDLMVEPQVEIPQLRVVPDRDQLARYGLTVGDVNRAVAVAMNGRVVSQVLEGQNRFDLLLRLDEPYRNAPALGRLPIRLPTGGEVQLGSVARVFVDSGPNLIRREGVRRRVLVQFNVAGGHSLSEVVEAVEGRVARLRSGLPEGYDIEFDGQIRSQRSASQSLLVLGLLAFLSMLAALWAKFRSWKMALQVLASIPMAAVGAIAALWLTGQTLSVAALVGFISLAGIASRNVILLISHYLHKLREEGETLDEGMLVRAGQERLSPVMMTALTTAIGLIPLLLAAGVPGKEILYPIATVVVGGLVSSTLMEFFVTPALFWLLGRRDAQRLAAQPEREELGD